MPRFNKKRKKRPEIEARDVKILELYGLGYDQIRVAAAVGVSQPTVSRVISRRLQELAAEQHEAAAMIRSRQAHELEVVKSRIAPALNRGQIPAVAVLLKIHERQAKMYGSDAPGSVTAGDAAASAGALLSYLEGRLPPEVMDQVLSALAAAHEEEPGEDF